MVTTSAARIFMRPAPAKAPAARSKGIEGMGRPNCSTNTQPRRTTYPWRTRNSSVLFMGPLKFTLNLREERRFFSPAPGHNKPGDGFSSARRDFAVTQRLRQRIRVARIANGNCGDRLPADGYFENLTCFVARVAGQWMN